MFKQGWELLKSFVGRYSSQLRLADILRACLVALVVVSVVVGLAFAFRYLFGPFASFIGFILLFTTVLSVVMVHYRFAIRDLSRQEQQQALLAADAKDKLRSRDRFFAVLSHELRMPLSTIIASLDILEQEPLPEATKYDLKNIRMAVEVERRLINDLMDISRNVGGKLSIEKMDVQLHDLLNRTVRDFSQDFQWKQLNVSLTLSAADCWVYGDFVRLKQVFSNLFRNAIQYVERGGRITVLTRSDASNIYISIEDNGIGMEPEVIPKLFNAFEQGDIENRAGNHGLGLGLSICKNLIELHDGAIEAKSAGIGMGATFIITLPLHPTRKGSVSVIDEETQEPILPSKGRILFVEDDEAIRRSLTKVLRWVGYEVVTAVGVVDGLRAYTTAQPPFDIILSDIGLPDGDGTQLLRNIRAYYEDHHENRPIKAIAFSGYGQPQDLASSLSAGFMRHLVKPVDSKKLVEIIDNIIHNREVEDAKEVISL